MKSNPHLKAAILQVVNNQLNDNDPPETKQTYDRLIKEGFPEKEAKRLLGCVVSAEIFDVLKNKGNYSAKSGRCMINNTLDFLLLI